MEQNLTQGSILKNLLKFSLPYLAACFLQTFYGLADLFIIGQLQGDAAATTGVSVGSQLTHMLTVVIAGLAMGTTVKIANNVGSGNKKVVGRTIGNTIAIFVMFAVIATAALLLLTGPILSVMRAPAEAYGETRSYIMICFAGVPFITAYNVISAIFRGFGDTKSPLFFVLTAGIINIVLDYLLIGPAAMSAAGAALATVAAQAVSVVISLIFLIRKSSVPRVTAADLKPSRQAIRAILGVGAPIACQDGLVQVAFLVITAIANSRGVDVAAGVGIVEKIITFLFLVPSAFLSAVSAIGAQNAGAGNDERSIKTLRLAILICVLYGAFTVVICELFTAQIVSLFTMESAVALLGVSYLRSYTFDTVFAGIHFCLSGFFCAYNRAVFSFISNIASILLVRIPGAYLASVFFPDTLFPMGIAAPAGSVLSAIISACLFVFLKRKISGNRRAAG